MGGTPEIPEWIKSLRQPGYRNIFEYNEGGHSPFPDPSRPNLWGTETLAGDWNGNLLIVFKDFAETGFLHRRRDGRPMYSHAPNFATNRNLCALLSRSGRQLDLSGRGASSCGILYASASFLLRDSDARSGSVTNCLSTSWPVLEFTIAHMPRLTDIAVCGVDAFEAFCRMGGLAGNRRQAQEARQPLQWRGLRVHCTSHTQPTAINTRARDGQRGFDIAAADWAAILKTAFSAAPDT